MIESSLDFLTCFRLWKKELQMMCQIGNLLNINYQEWFFDLVRSEFEIKFQGMKKECCEAEEKAEAGETFLQIIPDSPKIEKKW